MNPKNPPDVESVSTGMTAATATITDAELVLLAAVSSNESPVHVDETALMPTSRRKRVAGCK
ncbi:MAG: hypothetical protein V5B34_02030 [Accumulibacter sp.]|jgi:acyl dehydratase